MDKSLLNVIFFSSPRSAEVDCCHRRDIQVRETWRWLAGTGRDRIEEEDQHQISLA